MRHRDFLGFSPQEFRSAASQQFSMSPLSRRQSAEGDEFHSIRNGTGFSCCEYCASAPLTLFRARRFLSLLHTPKLTCRPPLGQRRRRGSRRSQSAARAGWRATSFSARSVSSRPGEILCHGDAPEGWGRRIKSNRYPARLARNLWPIRLSSL